MNLNIEQLKYLDKISKIYCGELSSRATRALYLDSIEEYNKTKELDNEMMQVLAKCVVECIKEKLKKDKQYLSN